MHYHCYLIFKIQQDDFHYDYPDNRSFNNVFSLSGQML